MKTIKTVADACKALGTTIEEQFPPEVKNLFTDDELAYRELKLVVKALNQSDGKPWEPDYSNWDERKYYPWPDVDTSDGNKAGSGFSDGGYYYDYADTFVGSRLCFKSRELCQYAFNQFNDIYKRWLLISK